MQTAGFYKDMHDGASVALEFIINATIRLEIISSDIGSRNKLIYAPIQAQYLPKNENKYHRYEYL